MAPTNPCCNIGTKIKTKAMHVTSLSVCLRCYISHKKTIIIVGNVLEVEIVWLHWLGAGLLLSQDLTLAEETWRWPQSTSGASSSTLRNLLVLLLLGMLGMLGRGLLLPPRLLLDTQPSQIQSLFKCFSFHHQTLWMMKHSEWWLYIQWTKRLAVLSLHWQSLVGWWWGTFLAYMFD